MSTEYQVEIPHDIIIEIWSRLPSKSLLRLRRPWWLNLPPPIKLKLNGQHSTDLKISRPLNGLVCLYYGPNNGVDHDSLVLNITTRQLPETTTNVGHLFLCFDDKTKTYKVLRLYWENDVLKAAIYTLNGTNSSWREAMDPPRLFLNRGISLSDPRPRVNGTMYWLAVARGIAYIIAFDMAGRAKMLDIGGRLALIPWGSTEIRLLEECLKSKSVVVKEKICFPTVPFEKISDGRNWGVSPTGEVLLFDLYDSRKIYFDLDKKTAIVERYLWSHPNKQMKPCNQRSLRDDTYNHVKNVFIFNTNRDDVQHHRENFLIVAILFCLLPLVMARYLCTR
ncbi:OLC1v1025541C1 [Oldenlandia corymbosa var. corymbosa]|uniref:OLC1v1025541C1 n=1 Tax=Oldenlandia corymbosa var. corymbosa TaxID=529605 RepID=A0AAV1C7W8_OLDCO|nr:OLC1v1025541C1 [Oldenlandia corymbosa var. corymbosa]